MRNHCYSGTVQPIRKCDSLFECRSPQIHPVIIFWSGNNRGDLFVPNHLVPLVNINHALDPIGNHSDDSNTKQTGNNNVANTKQSSSTRKQLSIMKFNQLFTKQKCDSNVGGNVSKRAKDTNDNANMSVQRQFKDVWFQMYS